MRLLFCFLYKNLTLIKNDIRSPLDSDPNKRAKRVRSWYLYEQYKSLESNQLQAARALKDRSSQGRILHRELRERRARRRLCDQFGACQSESILPRGASSDTGTLASASTDDFIDSLCDVHASDATIVGSDRTYNLPFGGRPELDGRAANYGGDNDSDEEREVDSLVRDGSELVSDNVEGVHARLDLAQQEAPMIGESLEELSMASVKLCKPCRMSEHDGSFSTMWTRLVAFAYQVLRLNRGNCYYDYSSQVMTAVLACDILCKGLNKMCKFTQRLCLKYSFNFIVKKSMYLCTTVSAQ
ncbi:unnamed protein product, partial [Iphiclides podalirius]